MSSDHQNDLSRGLGQITGLVLSEETLTSVLELLVRVSLEALERVESVSVTMRHHENYATAAHSDGYVLKMDTFQYEAQNGPCIDAIREARTFRVDDLPKDLRWPHFTEEAAKYGVKSVLAVPLIAVEAPIGALNLYSRMVNAFDGRDETIAELFARQAAVVLANTMSIAEGEVLNDQLQDALRTRDAIGQAKGILMEREGVSAEGAFERLRERSQHANRKLRDIADDIVREVADRGKDDE